jgi:hypothetical protein
MRFSIPGYHDYSQSLRQILWPFLPYEPLSLWLGALA